MYIENHVMCNSVIQNFWLNGLSYIHPTLSLQIFILKNTFFITNKWCVQQVRQVHKLEHLHCCGFSCMDFCLTHSFHVTDSACKVRDGCMPSLHLHCVKLVKHLNYIRQIHILLHLCRDQLVNAIYGSNCC